MQRVIYTHPELWLASSSPRRAELLTVLGVDFNVLPSAACQVDEVPLNGERPPALVARLAQAKAAQALHWPGLSDEAVVLAGDTVVVLNDRLLGKPHDAEDAVRMLTELSGSTHQVMTAIAVANRHTCQVLTVMTEVVFMPLSPLVVSAYVATGEPLDKAGAYALQGRAAQFVCRMNGSWGAVVGLPQHETAGLLAQFGIEPRWVLRENVYLSESEQA